MNSNTEINNLLSGLIDKTVENLTTHSKIVSDLKRKIDSEFVDSHYLNLKSQLLEEIDFENKKLPPSKYVSLGQLFKDDQISKVIIGDIHVDIFKQLNQKDTKNRHLINIVFPSRNSSKIIHGSIELLISEIGKSHDIDFNIIFQVNNTSDNTIEVIVNSLKHYSKIAYPVNFYILETNPELQFSLPGSLNLGFKYILLLADKLKKKYKETLFSFWDDELLNLIPTPDSLFNSNLNELLSSTDNKAISGYMIDNRVNVSRWHELSKGFSSDIRFIHSKPYLHGGSGTVMRIEDYLLEGIQLGGIADTDLSEHLLKLVGYKKLQNLSYRNWPVRSNPKSPVFHPIETNILKWTIKYLMYQMAWENTYSSLNNGKYKIGLLWKKKIEQNRRDFHKRIDKYLVNFSPEKILDREFMHYYYLTIQNIHNKKHLYENLKKFRSRSLNIR